MSSGIAVFAKDAKTAEKFTEKLRISKAIPNIDPIYKYHVVTALAPYTKSNSYKERVGILKKSSPLLDVVQVTINCSVLLKIIDG
jgi:hypothetical protein